MSSKEKKDKTQKESKKEKKERKEKKKKRDSKDLETSSNDFTVENEEKDGSSSNSKSVFGMFRRSGRKDKRSSKHGSSDSLKRLSVDSTEFGDRRSSGVSIDESASVKVSTPSTEVVKETEKPETQRDQPSEVKIVSAAHPAPVENKDSERADVPLAAEILKTVDTMMANNGEEEVQTKKDEEESVITPDNDKGSLKQEEQIAEKEPEPVVEMESQLQEANTKEHKQEESVNEQVLKPVNPDQEVLLKIENGPAVEKEEVHSLKKGQQKENQFQMQVEEFLKLDAKVGEVSSPKAKSEEQNEKEIGNGPTINVKFADEDVPGSPFTSNVRPSGDEIQPVEENLVSSAVSDQFSEPTQRVSEVFEDLVTFGSTPAQPHDFVFDLKGYKIDDLETMVISPDGTELDSEIIETSPKTYTIRFVPKESGEHTIYVRFKSGRKKDIPGSPFKVFVEAPVWGGAAKCVAAGPGLERGVVNHPGEFTVWTRDAGPGGLAIAVEGPAKSEIKCTDNGDGSCNISYLPTTPGEYTIHIRFADEDIPGSPFKTNVSPEVEDRFRDLNVTDLAEGGLKVNQPASFSVQTNASVGDVKASVVAPSGDEKEAQVSNLGGGNFAIRFTPREFGDHLVNVRFDGSHIPGSPFKIRVGGAEGHPEKVKAYGEGLSKGRVGEAAEFTVNALEAGSGALALSVDGPAKVKMNCSENADGTYQVTYNPVIAGEYTIRIKFAGQDIPGSPYNVTISPSDGRYVSDGDASKCTSRGTGLHSAVLGQPNSFTVNASNAGRGSLMVGVEGPAIPAKEINVKHTGSNVYAVNYALEEPGAYILKVLWADKHIPGSPFQVTV